MKYFRFLIIVTTVVTMLVNTVTALDSCLLVFGTIINLYITQNYPFKPNLAKYLCLLSYWIGMVLMPAYQLVVSLNYDNFQQIDYNRVVAYGARIYFMASLTWLLVDHFSGKKSRKIKYQPVVIPRRIFLYSYIFIVALSLFCYSIGLGRMGSEAVVLPFHLGGIINLTRSALVPTMFAVVVENFIIRGKAFPRLYFLLYVLWCLIEVFAWLSKSVIVGYLLLTLFLLYYYYKPSLKKIVVTLMPIFVLFLVLYPVVAAMRTTDRNASLSENIVKARNETEAEEIGVYMRLAAPLNRTFTSPGHYMKDYSYINNKDFFDFSKVPVLYAMGGSAAYQTYIIDGYPPTAIHSSGTSGLTDPLLHGGYGLSYIIVVLIMIAASSIDKLYISKRYSMYLILALMLFKYCRSVNISALYDSVGLQTLFVNLLCVYLAYRLNFKNRQYN